MVGNRRDVSLLDERWKLMGALILLAAFGALSGAAQPEDAVKISMFVRPHGDARSILVTVGGPAQADRIVLELPKRSMAASAIAEQLPPGWTARRQGKRIELTGPENALPIRLRLDLSDSTPLESVDVKVFSKKRVVHESRGTLQSIAAVQLAQNASDLVLLPPLLTPGEIIDVTVLDVRKTTGVWFLGGNAAVVKNVGISSRPILQMRVPEDAAPDRPLELSYVEPWGETAVRASVFDQSRIVPRESEAPLTPRLRGCGIGMGRRGVVCTCGWFPSAESRRGILVDGGSASTPAATSQRSVCFLPEIGPHILTGTPTAGFNPRDQHKTAALNVTSAVVGNLKPGQSATMTWTVSGTDDSVGLYLRNTSPAVGSLAGGPFQIARTSGGSPNTLSRVVTGLAIGKFDIVAEPEESLSDSDNQEYSHAVAKAFRRELLAIADEAERVVRQWPPEPPRDEFLALLDRIGSEIHEKLPFPELEAFREAIDAILEEGRGSQNASVARADIILIADRPRDEKDGTWIVEFINLLRRLGSNSPLRKICIRTKPTGADVALYPPKYPSDRRSMQADAPLNLYLGLYNYEVSTGTVRQMEGNVNLLLDTGQVLDCHLPQGQSDSRRCRLIYGSTEDCQ